MAIIRYCGVDLDIHPILVAVWPYHMLPDYWPSYCGAGGGIGDMLVPEDIKGVPVSHLCADHDIRWSVCEDSLFAAIRENFTFYSNLRTWVLAMRDRSISRKRVEAACFRWFLAVCWGARHHFSPLGGGLDGNVETDAKTKRLRDAVAEYDKKVADDQIAAAAG